MVTRKIIFTFSICSSLAFAVTHGEITTVDTKTVPESAPPFGLDVKLFPIGGTHAYSMKDVITAANGLGSAVKVDTDPNYLKVDISPESPAAKMNFCSSAVGLHIFASTAALQRRPDNSYAVLRDPELNRELVDIGSGDDVGHGRLDGKGFFGHINANSVGLAVLFRKLKLGRNFLYGAEPVKNGDYLKIFWNHEIGGKEKGHLVVVQGKGTVNGEDGIYAWSSNSSGYGTVFIPNNSIKLGVVSRMEHPEKLAEWKSLPTDGIEAAPGRAAVDGKNDPYLFRMQKEAGTLAELAREADITIPDSFSRNYAAAKAAEPASK